MNKHAKGTRSDVIPALRYHDSAAAVEWLCRALGFEKHLVVPGEGGTVIHAELTFGNGMIVLGQARNDAFSQWQKTARELGGNAQSPYLIVKDADKHYAQAKAAGARIVYDIRDEDYGGRGYSCLDPEGNLWSFGTYDPWKSVKPKKTVAARKKVSPTRKAKAGRKPKLVPRVKPGRQRGIGR